MMPAFLTFQDLEAVAATRLRDEAISGLGSRVYSSIPKHPTYPLAVVTRTGGVPPIRVALDSAEIRVEVWGTSKSEAHDIAQRARVALLGLEGTTATDPVTVFISAVDDERGLTWEPDPKTGRDRYTFEMVIYAKGRP